MCFSINGNTFKMFGFLKLPQYEKLSCGQWLGEGPLGEVSLVNPLGSWGQLGGCLQERWQSDAASLSPARLVTQGGGGMLGYQATGWLDLLFSLHKLMSLETSQAD